MTRKNSPRLPWPALAVALLLVSALARSLPAAQAPGPGGAPGSPGSQDPLAEHLFAPDLVMRHQAEIGLSAAQRKALIEELQHTQTEMVPLQFEANEASEALVGLVSPSRIDEGEALAQAQRLMEIETRIKGKHLVLLVRIKNLLSAEQQVRLAEIRKAGGR